MEGVSIEDVMQMDVVKILNFAKDHGINLAGCKSLEQFRERLVLHLRVMRNQYFNIKSKFGARHSDSLGAVAQSLDQLLTRTRDAVADLDPELENVLVDASEGDDRASLLKQIESRRNYLRTAQYSVIVAGETNSGKSTFLNLLLGMDVLPASIFSCTAAVCVLKYSATFRAEILYNDSRTKQASFEGMAETRMWLEEIVAEKDEEKREQGLGIDVINVYLPAVILQSGVTLVDTPGIGENEAMYTCAMNYIKRNRAAAYIYIIKTDNAGGVHDDRLLEFLHAILVHNEQDKDSGVFDPSSAIFVCNRWDQVPEDQKEAVKDNVLSKLKDAWPKFDPCQVFFVSALNAQMHYDVDPHYVTEDYEEVLKGVKNMFDKARHNAVNQHYRWLKQFLLQSTSSLQTTIHNCCQSDEDLIKRFQTTRRKLEALQHLTSTTIRKLRLLVEDQIEKLCRSIAEMLTQNDVRKELTDWSITPFPPAPPLGSGDAQNQRWQDEVDMTIMKRIMEKVDEYLTDNGLDKQLQDALKEVVQKEMQLVDDEINSIMVDMSERRSLSSSVSSTSSYSSADLDDDESAQEMLRMYKERGGRSRTAHLRRISQLAGRSARSAKSSEATMAVVPKVMLRGFIRPVRNLMEKIGRVRRRSRFGNNPVLYMKERSEKILGVVCEKTEFFEQMTAKYHEKLDSFITDVDNSIPMFIASNTQQMEDIRNNRRKYLSHRNELIKVMENLEPLRELVRGFGSLYIRDVTADNINFILDTDQRRLSVAVSVQGTPINVSKKDSGLGESAVTSLAGSSSRGVAPPANPYRTSQGLWATYRWGHVAIGEEKQHVIGRNYIQALNENNLIREIARLRCLRFTHLAPFLGMSRMDDTAVFLFLGDLMSARRYLTKGFHEPRESVPRLLEGVLLGLAYLHREGLVHMELSLETIMVNRDGEPRLCGACLPRIARFPPDAHQVTAEPFVCLSPEVLRGELYTADDDCYSFGLVVWETCVQTKPFSDQRQMSLKEFRDTVHPSSMLGLGLASNDNLTETLSAILRGCLLPARGLRIRMEDLREKVSTLRCTYDFPTTSVTSRRGVRTKPRKLPCYDENTY